jgi:hypothetical protein
MQFIKELFDPNKDIFRSIEKVVTFGNTKEEALKREVSEYVATERIKENFHKLLDDLSTGMDAGTTEIGIWVSGFYGSGKSSFSKYFGLALDKELVIDNIPFYERLANRVNDTKVTPLLRTIITRHNPTVFLIDLATQQISGYDLAPVSTIIYNEVMKWAGYASEGKIAMLERTLEMDNKLDEFKAVVEKEFKEVWDEIKITDVLKAKGIAQDLASRFYPNIWRNARDFNVMQIDDIESERERMSKMLDLIKKKSGRDKVLFIIDEVGQYISAKEELILKLQGTLETLKDIGQGKAWLLATAQQTLTEDNQKAKLNSEKLFKLNDRFPVKIDIEASDIREITTQRLLGKSNEGAAILKALYQKQGEKLRLYTRLEKTHNTPYKSELDEKGFIDLYPFLPHHFDILLNLLSKLAKKTGGVGLRSALRVIQDILTERGKAQLAEANIGQLATTVHIFNILKSDIRKSYSHVVAAVEKVIEIYGENDFKAEVAKSIGVLQLLDDLHLSLENLTALMHPTVDSDTQLEKVKDAVRTLKQSSSFTLKEIDGQLRFMTEAISKLEQDKEKIFVGGNETRRIIEQQIDDLFKPTPSARIFNTKTVRTGIIYNHEERLYKLAEPGETIQTEIKLVGREKYKNTVEEITRRSTERNNKNKIYLVGLIEEELTPTLEEIVRSQEIGSTRTRYNDKEILDYLNGQIQDAQSMSGEVRRKITNALENGEFIFRGATKPVKTANKNLKEACNQQLKELAEKVFDKYKLAPENVEGTLSEKLLKFDDLKQVPSSLSLFNLIKSDGSIDVNHPALKEIEEHLRTEGQVEGKNLLDYFEADPYGWSKDTTRYLVTVMFLASTIKLRIGGEDIKVKGPKAVEALRNANGFKKIGLSLYEEGRPSPEQIAIARDHIIELTGETPAPLPQKLAECVMRQFPEFRKQYATLEVQLKNLGLPGIERAQGILSGINLMLDADGSNAPFLLGKKDAPLFKDLQWAKKVSEAIAKGIEQKIKTARQLQSNVAKLPASGIPGELVEDVKANFEKIDRILETEDFFEKEPELNEALTEVKTKIADYFQKILDDENEKVKAEVESIKKSYPWNQLKPEQKAEFSARMPENLIVEKSGIEGIQEVLNEAYGLRTAFQQINADIKEALKAEEPPSDPLKKTIKLNVHLPSRVETADDIDRAIQLLQSIKEQLEDNTIIELNW